MQPLTPPPGLKIRILSEIQRQQKCRQLKRAAWLSFGTLAGSWLALVLLAEDFFRQASRSGFTEMGQLLLTDFGIIRQHLADYLFSLAESLPAASLGLVCLALLLIIFSAIKLAVSASELKHLNSHA